ncbi:MAG: GNAT family N-acetyltransferase, partial [Clostridiales bacterium]|nr:GNAT family N-acetyltransferase [Clostridiales bacterium]
MVEAAVDPADRGARRAGFLQNLVVDHPLIEQLGHLIALLHGLQLRDGAEVFNKAALEAAVAGLPADYRIEMIDESIFRQCSLFEWSRDLVSQYKEYPEYRDHGLGVVIL